MRSRGVTQEDLIGKLVVPSSTSETSGNVVFVKPKDPKNLQKVLDKVITGQIKGIPGIRRALVSETGNEWVITTDGSNLPKVMRIQGIDLTRTTTNNIHEIAETLGIEAARKKLIQEAQGVLEEQGLDVDVRHVMLVADIMTLTGEVYQIGRHGVSGKKASVIARAAFEITVPTLVEAASKGTIDMFKGVTESVIVGQNIPVGTGIIEIYMRMGRGEMVPTTSPTGAT
jgi:DNA-directed RNA polymerase beta' subunit